MTGSKWNLKDYINTGLRGFFLQNGFNYSNFQGLGYANMLYPALKKKYGNDKAKLCAVLKENCEFYNTNPHFVPFVTSLHMVMLENDRKDDEIRGIKLALMGPLAGIGDSLSQFMIAPLMSTIAASLAGQGLVLGPILFFVVINVILTSIKLLNAYYGYKFGASIVDKMSDKMATISRVANIIGITVIAGLASTFVKINIPIQLAAGKVEPGVKQQILSIQGMMDKIAPALLPILFTLFIYWLIKCKKWTTYKLVLLIVLIGILGSVTGVLA